MTLGRQLRPDKAVAAAHMWLRASLRSALEHDFPTRAQAEAYNEAALMQIRSVIVDVIDSFNPPMPRKADWD